YGYPPPVLLDDRQVREIEPALSPRVRAAVLIPDERCVRPESLVQGLEARLLDLGVSVRRGEEVRGFARRNGTVTAALTTTGPLAGDHFLIAAGAWSGLLASRCGLRLPLTAARGYSITLSAPTLQVGHLVYLTEAKVAVTSFRAALRFAGTLELAGLSERADPRRLVAVRRAADLYLAERAGGATEWSWMGLRPVTPDGLPLIGRLPGHDNLYMAAGHGMLGVTLAPATASAIAGLMLEGRADADLAPFDPARFVPRSARPASGGIHHD
ncbi:MAG: FAD-dependent oxidoreductase, partial [Armatimonadota bacterium]|nr:FAD-dependent oxidoreductase [Armatimonadota bacterium]